MDQPLDALIKKKKKVDGLAKKKPLKAGGPAPTGKKLNKPEGKGIVKGQGNQQKAKGPVKGGKSATTPKGSGRASPVTKGTPKGNVTQGRVSAATRNAPVKTVTPVKGNKGSSRGGIRNKVMTQPIPQPARFQPARQQQQQKQQTFATRGGRGGFSASFNNSTRPAFKKTKTPFNDNALLAGMTVTVANDQYQEYRSPPPQLQVQQRSFEEDNYQSHGRTLGQKQIDFEEVDVNGVAKLRSLDSIFKSIHSATASL
jgi:hypothetical protein